MGSDVEVTEADKHHPTLYSAGRHGHWGACPCGWSSETYGTNTGAHLAFGRHMISAEHLRRVTEEGS